MLRSKAKLPDENNSLLAYPVNAQSLLLDKVNSWFQSKKFKYQRTLTSDKLGQCFQMSISYNERDIMLYELEWEVHHNSIKLSKSI